MGDVNHRIEIHHAVLHESPELQGYNFLRCWLLFGTYWVAYHGHDSGDIWVCHTIQWILVYSGSVSSEDAYYWLGVSTAFRDIIL